MPIAVVTGAIRGLGLETAHVLARRGYKVWLTGRDAASTEHAAATLRDHKLDVSAATLDVASGASVGAFAQFMAAEPAIASESVHARAFRYGQTRECRMPWLGAHPHGWR